MSEAKRCLTEVWGFDEFRGVQEAVIRRLLCEGLGATVLMPTGGGKSLLYQVQHFVPLMINMYKR